MPNPASQRLLQIKSADRQACSSQTDQPEDNGLYVLYVLLSSNTDFASAPLPLAKLHFWCGKACLEQVTKPGIIYRNG